MKLTGNITALITPFFNGSIDYNSLIKTVNYQVSSEVNGIVVLSAIGEGMALMEHEKEELIRFIKNVLPADLPLIVGVDGAGEIDHKIRHAGRLVKLGADAILAASPCCRHPSQKGIYQYYKYLHDNVNIPIILSGMLVCGKPSIEDHTAVALAGLPRVIGLEDATPNPNRALSLSSSLPNRDFTLLSGDDVNILAFNVHGGSGCISTISNIFASMCTQMQIFMSEGLYKEARELHSELISIIQLAPLEANPVNIKYLSYITGLIKSPEVRLPLSQLDDKAKQQLRNNLDSINKLRHIYEN